MRRVLNRFLHLLFPGRCPMCDELLGRAETYICDACRAEVKFTEEPYCMKCGKTVFQEEEFCNDCLRHIHVFDRGRTLLLYEGPVKKSIYRFKYAGRKEYAEAYAYLTEQKLGDYIRSVQPDAFVPVPLHRERFRKRGYNQAELFGAALGRRMGIPVEAKIAKRTKNTLPQKELDLAMRQNNLKKAFKICRNDVKLNTIIIIDDIYTTGSTIDALAECFREAGVSRIYFLAISGGR